MAVTIPFTQTQTSHGLILKSAPGIQLGAITEWDTGSSRGEKKVFEFGQQTIGINDVSHDSGEPYETVPGNIGQTQISVKRYDLYTSRIQTAFGTPSLDMLTKQVNNLQLYEYWTAPDQTLTFTRIYYGCWFTHLGYRFSAEGDRVIMADATITYTRYREV